MATVHVVVSTLQLGRQGSGVPSGPSSPRSAQISESMPSHSSSPAAAPSPHAVGTGVVHAESSHRQRAHVAVPPFHSPGASAVQACVWPASHSSPTAASTMALPHRASTSTYSSRFAPITSVQPFGVWRPAVNAHSACLESSSLT